MDGNGVPRVCLVDDEPERVRKSATVGFGAKASCDVLHPSEVTDDDLATADLVAVDYLLSEWAERDAAECIALQPTNGLSLAAVLRERARELTVQPTGGGPIAFALHSGQLDRLRADFPGHPGEHVIAKLNNLEWVFAKEDAPWDGMVSLANAARQLPEQWPQGDGEACEAQALELLGLPDDGAWRDLAAEAVLGCRPPIHDLCGGAHGMLFVRWLLHEVLPYPCFLIGKHWVAARLGLTLEAFRAVEADHTTQLAEDLRGLRYTGPLHDFLEARWWRAGLDAYVWSLLEGRSRDVGNLRGALVERSGRGLDFADCDPAMVTVDSRFRPRPEFVGPEDAVRIRPDQWPAFADDAWATIADARDSGELGALVHPADRYRVGAGAQGG